VPAETITLQQFKKYFKLAHQEVTNDFTFLLIQTQRNLFNFTQLSNGQRSRVFRNLIYAITYCRPTVRKDRILAVPLF